MMTVDEIYHNIGQSLACAVDNDDWEIAILNIDFEGEGVVGYSGTYRNKSGNQDQDLSVRKIPREFSKWITELHEITTEGGGNKWNKAIFSLWPAGKFDMKFIWDQELNDEIEKLSKA